MSKIRVACVYGSMAKGGGAEQSVLGLIRGLDRQRFDPCLILRRRVENEHDLSGIQVLSAHCRSASETWWMEWRFAVEVFCAVRRLRIDIVHSHSGTSPADRLGLLAAGLAGARVVRTMRHTPIPVHGRFGLLRRLFDHYTACWTVVSPDITEHLSVAAGVASSRIVSTPNGIDLSRYAEPAGNRELMRESLGVGAGDRVLLAVGRLAVTKDHATLIRAMPMILSRCRNVKLMIAGGGDSRSLEKCIADLGVQDSVRLLGYREDVPNLLAAADIFVSASLNEGLPRAMVEAMAAGVPVIATDIPGTHHLLDNGSSGILVPVKSPESMAQAIFALVAAPDERARLGRYGKDRAFEHFSTEAMVRRYEALYERLMTSGVPA